jgi:hypothetical protein
MMYYSILLFLFFQIPIVLSSQGIDLPKRPELSLSGSDFAASVKDYQLHDREDAIYREVISGNIPDFQRKFNPFSFHQSIDGHTYQVTYYVIPEYVAIGSDTDYFIMPMTPSLAGKLCDTLHCSLPTKKMVDQIWNSAAVKLDPSPIAPSLAMTTIPVMWQHNLMVRKQRSVVIHQHPLGTLVSGHKKDVVISNKIYNNTPNNKVVIYGWHYTNGNPIQPVYNGHGANYVDYSHGIRLVYDRVTINGQAYRIADILQHDTYHQLLSDEGKILVPKYPLTKTD